MDSETLSYLKLIFAITYSGIAEQDPQHINTGSVEASGQLGPEYKRNQIRRFKEKIAQEAREFVHDLPSHLRKITPKHAMEEYCALSRVLGKRRLS